MLDEAFALFATAAPTTVMIRGVLENILSARRLDAIFEDAARAQYTRQLAFSSVVRLMSQVVMRIRPSVHASYKQQAPELGVSAKCVYDKLDGIEPEVSRELVRRTGREMELVIQAMGGVLPALLPGFRVKILDGNHLAGTDRRLKLLRRQGGAVLPGQSLVVLDPSLRMVIDLLPCEDAHTQERALLPRILETVESGDLWIEDRNFCTSTFVFGVARRGAAFLVRQHARSLRWKLLGDRVYRGEIESGRVFEQAVQLVDEHGKELIVRRISIELHHPTRDGEMVLHLLTNVTAEQGGALTLARLYAERWLIETAFQELTVNLACEVATLGYPKAALFAFSVAVVFYNAFSVIKTAIRVRHPDPPSAQLPTSPERPAVPPAATVSPKANKLSTYYLADEIAGNWRGMMVVLPEPFWKNKFADLTPTELAAALTDLAGGTNAAKYRQRDPSRKRSERNRPRQPGSHVSTARILNGTIKRKC